MLLFEYVMRRLPIADSCPNQGSGRIEMSTRPVVVLLSSAGVADLGTALQFWTNENPVLGPCVNCKSVNVEGPYFRMVIEEQSGDKWVDLEFSVHHEYIRGYVIAPAIKRLGFT